MAKSKNDTVAALLMAMKKAHQEMKLLLRNKLREHNIDLTFEMLQVLMHLWDRDGVNQQELANLLLKDKASLVYLIDNLSKRKLVRRTEDGNDRRNKMITLMPEGERLRSVIVPWMEELYAIAGKDISVQHVKEGIVLFERIYQNVNKV